ncbi:MAG TPA: hypothetical protein VHH73_07250, partial [Verrucomicrobiae bacterium]|nr:hypothetical protein [Verrucomicrobiae bacterium]
MEKAMHASLRALIPCALLGCLFALLGVPPVLAADHGAKPVFLYTRYYNAVGENRYLPDGTFKDLLQRLGGDFEVRANSDPLTEASLRDVKVILIANPSDKAVGANPAPHHITTADRALLNRFIRAGGALILTENQENHNVEIEDTNLLMKGFGLQATNLYTDGKLLVLPTATPIIGGLRWAYFTGNSVLVESGHPAKPRALVMNDLSQKPMGGPRNQAGCLLAT